MPNDFGQWLRIERHRRGIDVDELAKRSGYSRSLIYMIENGRKPATPPAIHALEEALKDLLTQRQKPYVLEAALENPTTQRQKPNPLSGGTRVVHKEQGIGEIIGELDSFNGKEYILVFKRYCMCREEDITPCA